MPLQACFDASNGLAPGVNSSSNIGTNHVIDTSTRSTVAAAAAAARSSAAAPASAPHESGGDAALVAADGRAEADEQYVGRSGGALAEELLLLPEEDDAVNAQKAAEAAESVQNWHEQAQMPSSQVVWGLNMPD